MRRWLLTAIAPIWPVAAMAASWTQVPQYGQIYVDTAGVHRESFPRPLAPGWNPYTNGKPPMESYFIAWLARKDADGVFDVMLEVAFDCHGKMAVIQQIIQNDSATSQYHSFDNTQIFKSTGVQAKDVAPDSFYDWAQKIVCNR